MSRVVINTTQVDPNQRVNPLIEKVTLTRNEKTQRIVDAALPFLSLYQPTALISSITIGAVKSFQILSNLPKNFRTDKTLAFKELASLVFTISTVTLSIFMPPVSTLISQSYNIAVQTDRFARAIFQKKYDVAGDAAANIAISAIFITSTLTAAPEIIAISLIAQATFEFYQAIGEFRQGRDHFLQGMAKVVMACFRLSQAAPIVKDLHRDYFGKQITQVDIDRILEEIETERLNALSEDTDRITSDINHRGPIGDNFNDFLNAHFYSSNLTNLRFNGRELKNINFKNVKFTNCDLEDVLALNCKFSSVKFKNCSFEDFTAIGSSFKNSSITDSILTNAAFWNCNFSTFQFMNCDMTKTCLNESILDKFEIHDSTLLETNFFGVSVSGKSKLKNCDLTDTLLCDAKEKLKFEGCTTHHFTRPVIGMLWNFEAPQTYAAIGAEAVADNNGIALRVDYQPRDISLSKLESQVKDSLQQIQQMPQGSYKSIAQELVKKALLKSETAKIYNKAKEMMKHSQGLYLVGGKDIKPAYYGETQSMLSNPDSDHRRGLLEFSLISLAKDKPVLGICRGVQIYNVYEGGTLYQDLKGHSGGKRHYLSPIPDLPENIQAIIQDLVGDGLQGVSLHHQGCKKVADGLYVVLRAENDQLPECLMSKDGRFVGTQFHPEIYWSYQMMGVDEPLLAKGKNFFKRFIGLANDYRQDEMDLE